VITGKKFAPCQAGHFRSPPLQTPRLIGFSGYDIQR
jgi:hypothetical protein